MINPILFHTIQGNGEAVIILHGLLGTHSNWNSLAKQLSTHYKVVLPDLRNHGQSFHTNTMNYTEMAKDIFNLMNELSIKKAHIIGHSNGRKSCHGICNFI